jgi:hypothetical protein
MATLRANRPTAHPRLAIEVEQAQKSAERQWVSLNRQADLTMLAELACAPARARAGPLAA